ncbi:hypothetical protein PHLCEN_2v2278 [Hermanssonia centrifuga]|uniref:Uncharacterized protein n=1 Tax=Hermanssonia centrifuga TaxID=98765 RepID=A0A2R6RPK3_9APHY|nr:hypothetical protein PHLCEN_2v2278 [Hermanssonia centrifuga]
MKVTLLGKATWKARGGHNGKGRENGKYRAQESGERKVVTNFDLERTPASSKVIQATELIAFSLFSTGAVA